MSYWIVIKKIINFLDALRIRYSCYRLRRVYLKLTPVLWMKFLPGKPSRTKNGIRWIGLERRNKWLGNESPYTHTHMLGTYIYLLYCQKTLKRPPKGRQNRVSVSLFVRGRHHTPGLAAGPPERIRPSVD